MYTPCDHFPDLMLNDCRDIRFVSKSFVIKHDCVFYNQFMALWHEAGETY